MIRNYTIRAVLLDYGGVIAEEGFRDGLYAIARLNGHRPEPFYQQAQAAVYSSGYVTGRGSNADFWLTMRDAFTLQQNDAELNHIILAHFILRPSVIKAIRRLRQDGIVCGILSDQTDWLEQLDARDHFYFEFDRVYNSFRLGKGKKDGSLFDDVVRDLGINAGDILFIDDHPGNVERACRHGLHAIECRKVECILSALKSCVLQPPGNGN